MSMKSRGVDNTHSLTLHANSPTNDIIPSNINKYETLMSQSNNDMGQSQPLPPKQLKTTSASTMQAISYKDADYSSIQSKGIVLPLQIVYGGKACSREAALPILTEPSTSAVSPAKFISKNNLAKFHWWNTPVQPLELNKTIETSVAKKCSFPEAVEDNIDKSITISSQRFHRINCSSDNAQRNTHPSTKIFDSQSTTPRRKFHYQSQRSQPSDAALPATTKLGSLDNSSSHVPSNLQIDEDHISHDSQLLFKDPKPCIGLLNPGEDDEMEVTGYRRSRSRTFICWLCICLTGGLLRLVMHWWRHWYLISTHHICPLDDAQKVLVQEDYKGKHKSLYVQHVEIMTVSSLSQEIRQELLHQQQFELHRPGSNTKINVDEKNMHLSVHFSSAHFKQIKNVKIFKCKQIRYVWDNQSLSFKKLKGLDVNVTSAYFHKQKGLSVQEQISRRLVYGSNDITIPYRDIKTLLFLEVLNPFYVFQIFSVLLWFTYDYYYYACVILFMSIFGISMSIIQTKKNQDALRKTVENTGCALVVNDKGDVRQLPTKCLVPGDIVEIPKDGCTMQCDAVLLSGNCILDESMLTGESVPVTKTPLPMKRDIIFDKKEHARHTLFCGTKIIQTRYIGSEQVLAIVINTGNITAKGGLIRSILYPPPVDYKFEQDSYKFIECLGLIALIGFFYTLVSKIMRDIDPVKIAVESLDLITIVVPPALPAAMTVGRFYAQKRLEMNNIYCISPRSINVAGSIDCCCFDKTGTLTEDGLDMWGVVPKSATNQFQIPIKQIERLPCDNFLFGMVTCHSITVMNGRLMGDPLDLKMFESTGWILEDPKDIPDNQKFGLIHPTIVRQPKNCLKLEDAKIFQRQSSVDDLLADVGLLNGEASNDHGIVREFPFTSNLQRMSVITKRLCEKNFTVYCKGSPEMLQQLCQPSSLPENYSQQLAIFAKQGYRIIAMAYKSLSRKTNYTKAQRLSRESIECNLEFLGFVVLENRLKPDTTEVIRSLTSANIRTIMVTGDNVLTAVSVARDCGIVSPSQAVVTVNVRSRYDDQPPLQQERDTNKYELYYTLELGSSDCNTSHGRNGNGILAQKSFLSSVDVKNNYDLNGDISSISSVSVILPTSSSLTSVQTCDTWTNTDIEMGRASRNSIQHEAINGGDNNDRSIPSWHQNYRFAMVGKTWQIVREHFPEELRNFITRGAIFARMSPEQKQSLIMELQNLDYCVAMCGDGANDCGALKVAHTGISLSETESSIASPFTSRNATIACVPNVIKEGRAALVTSFGIFKYMAAYSMVQFVSVMILYSIDSNLTDKQYLYIDLGLISVFAFFFGKTESYAGPLVGQVPLSSLISLTPLASIILHLLIVIGFQVTAWFHLHQQPWFTPFQLSDENHLGCYENYAMFAISSFQYIVLAIVFSKGSPYRKPIWTNVPFCLALFINLCIVIYLIIYPTDWIAEFFQISLPPQMGFRYIMLVYGATIFMAHVLLEMFIVEFLLFKKYQVRRERNMRTSKRKYMHVEYDLQYFHNWPQITEVYEAHDTSQEEVNQPTYVELSAEQNFEMPAPKHNALSSFFEVDTTVNTPPSNNTG